MADSNNFLLDTGILLHYARASQLGHSIEQRYGFTKSNFKPLVCVVTIGEIQAIANRCQWGKQKLDTLQRIINNLVRIDISHEEVINAFAKIRSFAVGSGFSIGDNDQWIAATSQVINATLLTTDKDFDPLHDSNFINRIYIDQSNFNL